MSVSLSDERGDSVAAALSHDHDRLDAILCAVTRMVADGDLEHAHHAFGEFDRGLRHHIQLEEELLFPVFEERAGVPVGPTVVMRYEHSLITGWLDRMSAALERANPVTFGKARVALEDLLARHHEKEERVLYPLTDRALEAHERAALVERFTHS